MCTSDNDNRDNPETIEVVRANTNGNSVVRWTPSVGSEMLELLQHTGLTGESQARVQSEAVSIVSKCVSPTQPSDHCTGLVVGNIQSGKTLSFTAVTALARDNGFQMVIIITGTSIPLFDQSRRRLEDDLRLSTRPDRKWQHFSNPRIDASGTIADTLHDWTDPMVSDAERQSILITVMKNHRHLSNLVELLRSLDMNHVAALVIDDEADQAGLNTRVNAGDESTTYRHLIALRQVLPHHTFLQYTATPQAPLLINLIDVLSPNFAEVLTPGGDYTGGREFFIENGELELIRIIHPDEIPSARNPIDDPPESLLEAMQLFFVGVAAGMHEDGGRGNRSMMVHPSQKTLRHAEYHTWVRSIKERWQTVLDLPENDPDKTELLADFEEAYNDLSTTVHNLPDFAVLAPRLARAIRRTQITEVNAARGRTPVIDWRSSYSHILVGGQAMDRGFTVEGLTVTYMPRGVGVGNADTIQQRARFFGYKRPYLGFCRIFLEEEAERAYRSYVEHEDDIRTQLVRHCEAGRPLAEWKRAFFLSAQLRPTRRNVLDLDYMRGNFSDEWFSVSRPHDSEDAVESNRQLVATFVNGLELMPDEGHPDRTTTQRHLTATSTLTSVYESLLANLRVTDPTDSQKFTGALLQLQSWLEDNPDAPCQVYKISPNERRTRRLSEADDIPNLFQGEYPVEPKSQRGSIYPGDRRIRSDEGITVQIHTIDLRTEAGPSITDVPVIAVWFPSETARAWIVQDED